MRKPYWYTKGFTLGITHGTPITISFTGRQVIPNPWTKKMLVKHFSVVDKVNARYLHFGYKDGVREGLRRAEAK